MTDKITHSLVKSYKACQNATKYRYIELLKPKVFRSKPLKRGVWFHELLEARYKGESVKEVHKRNKATFESMLDEEQEALGRDLPNEMARLYRSYNWYYQNEKLKVHEVELLLEAELPNGLSGQGKIDMLVEDEYGLWIWDHKTHQTLPRWDYRLLDQQAPYYIWLARKMGIPVQGFVWNYIVPTGPEPLRFTKGSKNVPSRLYKMQPAVTDYPTVDKALTTEQREMPEVQEILSKLYLAVYDRDTVQTSPVFRRDLLEPTEETIDEVVRDIMDTGEGYETFKQSGKPANRTVSRSCERCDYRRLCIAELTGENADGVRHREFTTHDPYAYYKDAGVENM